MLLIQGLTSDPLQKMTLVLPTGDSFSMTIYFRPIQQGWFINNLTYNNFILNGVRIVVSPNFLNQFRNKIPFGIACLSVDNREPALQEDFSSGNCRLYLATQQETNRFAEILTQG